jgi:hypothetical protein
MLFLPRILIKKKLLKTRIFIGVKFLFQAKNYLFLSKNLFKTSKIILVSIVRIFVKTRIFSRTILLKTSKNIL